MVRRMADEMDRMFEGFGFPGLHRGGVFGGTERFMPEIDLFERKVADVAYPIWHLLALEIWCREVLENREQPAANSLGATV